MTLLEKVNLTTGVGLVKFLVSHCIFTKLRDRWEGERCVGQVLDNGAQPEYRFADTERIANPETEPAGDRTFGYRPERSILRGQGSGKRLCRGGFIAHIIRDDEQLRSGLRRILAQLP